MNRRDVEHELAVYAEKADAEIVELKRQCSTLTDALEAALLAVDSVKDDLKLGPLTRNALRVKSERIRVALRSIGRLNEQWPAGGVAGELRQ